MSLAWGFFGERAKAWKACNGSKTGVACAMGEWSKTAHKPNAKERMQGRRIRGNDRFMTEGLLLDIWVPGVSSRSFKIAILVGEEDRMVVP